jgi:hypothetical protein
VQLTAVVAAEVIWEKLDLCSNIWQSYGRYVLCIRVFFDVFDEIYLSESRTLPIDLGLAV